MKKLFKSINDAVSNSLTHNAAATDTAVSNARRAGAADIMSKGGGIVTKSGELSQNPQVKGFMFEKEYVRRFNENEAKSGSRLKATGIPVSGVKGEVDIIITDQQGVTVKRIQCKTGSATYVKDAIESGKYDKKSTDTILINTENADIALEYQSAHIDKMGTLLDRMIDNMDNPTEYDKITVEWEQLTGEHVDVTIGDENCSLSDEQMKELAKDPKAHVNQQQWSADLNEIWAGVKQGAKIGGIYQACQESIKVLGSLYRGEEVDKSVLTNALKDVGSAMLSGGIRGGAIKVINVIIKRLKAPGADSSLPIIIISIGPSVFMNILAYLNEEKSLEECIEGTGAVALSSGFMVTLCMLIPPVGLVMMGYSVLSLIWEEFELKPLLLDTYPDAVILFDKLDTVGKYVNKYAEVGKAHYTSAKK